MSTETLHFDGFSGFCFFAIVWRIAVRTQCCSKKSILPFSHSFAGMSLSKPSSNCCSHFVFKFSLTTELHFSSHLITYIKLGQLFLLIFIWGFSSLDNWLSIMLDQNNVSNRFLRPPWEYFIKKIFIQHWLINKLCFCFAFFRLGSLAERLNLHINYVKFTIKSLLIASATPIHRNVWILNWNVHSHSTLQTVFGGNPYQPLPRPKLRLRYSTGTMQIRRPGTLRELCKIRLHFLQKKIRLTKHLLSEYNPHN